MNLHVRPGLPPVRILICSPSDVDDERDRARHVIDSLRRRYARQFTLRHLLWEDLPLQADMPFQEGLESLLSREGGIDVAVFILWSRLGTPPGVRKPDGSSYLSGTEREFDMVTEARAKSNGLRPGILVYRRADENSFHERLRDRLLAEQQDALRQKQLVVDFFKKHFSSEDGANTRAYHSYETAAGFSKLLREHLQRLLDGMAHGLAHEAIWDTAAQGPPYVGLEAFQPDHADVFFGREDDVLDARHRLREQARNNSPFLLLCGASGSGKSSLARAGIVPAIVETELDEDIAEWRTAIVMPQELSPDPLAALVARLRSKTVLPELLGDTAENDLVEALKLTPHVACNLQLKAAFKRADEKKGGPVRLLLVVDQLEEFFASEKISDSDRSAFFNALEEMVHMGRIWVVATIRADFYEELQREPAVKRMKASLGQMDVLPPDADALRRMVEEPAHLAGLRFEEREGHTLADQILGDAAKHAELLPLVQDLLLELYLRRSGDLLTFAAYETLGNSVEGVLARRADRVFDSLPDDAKNAFDEVFRALVTLGENKENLEFTDLGATHAGGEHVVRQRVVLSQFPKGTPARRLVDEFIDQRLFTATASTNPDNPAGVVTVAHESLLRVWGRAADWAETNRDFLHTRAHVAQRFKDKSLLPESDPLFARAKVHLDRNPGGFPEDLRKFIEESVLEVEEKRRRERAARVRLARFLYTAAAAVIAVVVGLILFFSWRRVQDAVGGQLIAEAERNMSQLNYARAEIAAARALHYRDDKDTRQLLVDARGGGVLFKAGVIEKNGYRLSVVSRDGSVRAVVTPDSGITISVMSTADQKEHWSVALPAGAEGPDSMAFSERTGGVRSLAVAWESDRNTKFRVDLWRLVDRQPAQHICDLVSAGGTGRHTKRIPSMAFHPSQPWIATSGEDTTIALWNYSTSPPTLLAQKNEAHDTSIHGIAFNADGSRLASGGGDYAVKVWETALLVAGGQGEPTVLVGHTDSVFAVAFSPDGKQLASGGYDRLIRIWDLDLARTVGTLSGHQGTVYTVAFTDDGKLLASGGSDSSVRLWDVGEGRLLTTITPGIDAIRSLAFHDFEGDLQVGGDKGWSVWSVRGHSMSTRLWNAGATIGAIAFDPTGRYVAAGGDDGKVRVWDRDHGFRSPVLLDSQIEKESINGIAFSRDGRWIAAGGAKKTIHIWDRTHGWAKVVAKDPLSLRHDGTIWGLCFDPLGRWLASSNASDTERIRRWKIDDWSLLDQTDDFNHSIYTLACSQDGKRLVSGDSDGRVFIWETDRLSQVTSKENVPTGEKNVWSVAIGDPLSIVTGNSDGYVRKWIPVDPVWTGNAVETLKATSKEDAKVNRTINSVSISKKHGWIAAGGDGPSIEIYDADLKRIRSLKGHTGTIWFVAFDPEGARIAYGGTGRILRIFDLDQMDQVLGKAIAPDRIYRDSQRNTGLSIVDNKIVNGVED